MPLASLPFAFLHKRRTVTDKLDLSDVKVARIKVSSLCGAGHVPGAAQEKECVMAIRKIMCACGSGLGSSLIVHMNTEEIVKKLGHPEIEVDHTTVSDINPTAADLFVVGGDLADFVAGVPDEKKLVLKNIVDKVELEEKLRAHLS